MLRVKTRIGKRNTLYIPKGIAEALGIRENSVVELKVENGRLIVEVVPDPFELALRGRKFAAVKFEEFERESEEMQDELFRRRGG